MRPFAASCSGVSRPQEPAGNNSPNSLSAPPWVQRVSDPAVGATAGLLYRECQLPNRAFIVRQVVQLTLPHADPGDIPVWKRSNGYLTLSIRHGWDHENNRIRGYPYVTLPRLLLFWMTTEDGSQEQNENALVGGMVEGRGEQAEDRLGELGESQHGGHLVEAPWGVKLPMLLTRWSVLANSPGPLRIPNKGGGQAQLSRSVVLMFVLSLAYVKNHQSRPLPAKRTLGWQVL